MRTNRIAASIVLAAAVLVGTVSPALAQTTTPHFLPGVTPPSEIAWAIQSNPERMFGPGTVSNVVDGIGFTEFDTSAYWAAGAPSVHVKMYLRQVPSYNHVKTYEITLYLSNGAEGVVTHRFAPFFRTATIWTNDHSELKSGKGPLADALLHEVHNLVVIPNVKALAAQLAVTP